MQQRNFIVINNGLTGVLKRTIALKLSTTVVQLNYQLANDEVTCDKQINSRSFY